MNLSSQLWEFYFLYMNLSSQLWEFYSQDKPEKFAAKAPSTIFRTYPSTICRTYGAGGAGTKDIFYYFFLSVLVTWWQKEKGWPQKAHNRNLRKQLAKTIKIL